MIRIRCEQLVHSSRFVRHAEIISHTFHLYHIVPSKASTSNLWPLRSALLPCARGNIMTSRPKRNRPSYAKIFQPFFSDEEEIIPNVIGESDSEPGSVFNPTVGAEGKYEAESPTDEEPEDLGLRSRKRGDTSATAINAATLASGTQNLLSVSRPHRPGISVAPNIPSKDHRHRPNGLWAPPSDVYRLVSPPIPLSKFEVVRTNSADHPAVMQRVKKAWANSSGIGPVWELLEDRAFFKEEWTGYDLSSRKGRKRRPVVFPNVRAQPPQILSRKCVRFSITFFSGSQSLLCNRDASRYLPHDEHEVSTIKVSVGPVESQSTRHLCLFDSLVLGNLIKYGFCSRHLVTRRTGKTGCPSPPPLYGRACVCSRLVPDCSV